MHAKGVNYHKAVEIRKENPCKTLLAIGNELGITRERVRQLLQAAHLQTGHSIQRRSCLQCDAVVTKRSRTFCSQDCHDAFYNVAIECAECHKVFTRIASKLVLYPTSVRKNQQHYYCSRECFKAVRRGKPLNLVCTECGKEYTRTSDGFRISKVRNHFCSREHYRDWSKRMAEYRRLADRK